MIFEFQVCAQVQGIKWNQEEADEVIMGEGGEIEMKKKRKTLRASGEQI